METKSLSASGGVVYWTCGPTSRDRFKTELQLLNLDRHVTALKTDYAALTEAVKGYCETQSSKFDRSKGRDKSVQKRKNRKAGVELVEIERGDVGDRNHYTTDFGASVKNGQVIIDNGWAPVSDLQSRFDYARENLSGSEVGKSLVSILDALGAVKLRPSGGLYWVPGDSLPRWSKVAQAVKDSALTQRGNKTYCLLTQFDEQAMEAVRDAITAEIRAEVLRLQGEIQSGSLGDDALENRRQQALAMRSRVKRYESIIGEALDTLQTAVSSVEQSIAVASLQAL